MSSITPNILELMGAFFLGCVVTLATLALAPSDATKSDDDDDDPSDGGDTAKVPA